MIVVALGLMMDAADRGRYFRDVVSSRSRNRVVWVRNLRRSDFYKRHRSRVVARHRECPRTVLLVGVPPMWAA